MKKYLRIAALAAVFVADQAFGTAIQVLNISSVNDLFIPSEFTPLIPSEFQIFGPITSLELSNGEIAQLGAGSSAYTYASLKSVNSSGDEISYEFSKLESGPINGGGLFFRAQLVCPSCIQDSYGVWQTWSEAVFIQSSPLVLKALVGGSTATLTASLLVGSANLGWGADDDFTPLASSKNSIVPIHMTYTLLDGKTWTKDTFNEEFWFSSNGTVDLSPVPEPSSKFSLIVGLLALGYILNKRNHTSSCETLGSTDN
jgi:hypothetical protein